MVDAIAPKRSWVRVRGVAYVIHAHFSLGMIGCGRYTCMHSIHKHTEPRQISTHTLTHTRHIGKHTPVAQEAPRTRTYTCANKNTFMC